MERPGGSHERARIYTSALVRAACVGCIAWMLTVMITPALWHVVGILTGGILAPTIGVGDDRFPLFGPFKLELLVFPALLLVLARMLRGWIVPNPAPGTPGE